MPAYGILRNSVIRFCVCRAQSKKCRFKFNPQMPLFIFGEKSRILTWKYMRPAPIAAIYLSYLGYLPMTYRVLFSCAVRGRKIPFLWPDLPWLYLIFFCKLYCLPPLRRHLSHAIRIVWKRQDWTGNSLPIHVVLCFTLEYSVFRFGIWIRLLFAFFPPRFLIFAFFASGNYPIRFTVIGDAFELERFPYPVCCQFCRYQARKIIYYDNFSFFHFRHSLL